MAKLWIGYWINKVREENKFSIKYQISPEAREHILRIQKFRRLCPYLSQKGQLALRRKWGL
jgi:hypothetical protein